MSSKINLVAAWILAILFTYAAITKWLDYFSFAENLAGSHYTSRYPHLIAVGLPFLELIIAILLIYQPSRYYGFYGGFVLMLSFTCYIGFLLAYGSHLPCSCGGILSNMGWRPHFYFNICFTLLALFGLIMERHRVMKKNCQ